MSIARGTRRTPRVARVTGLFARRLFATAVVLLLLTGMLAAYEGPVHGADGPSGIVYSVPLTITNSQSSPTSAPFQQMIVINSASYNSYEAANLQNVEFFDTSGSVIPSWLESGNSNAATNTVYWLRLAGGIPADSSVTLYMGFATPTTNLFNSQTTGEAPQLTQPYALYDDGQHVFNFYDDFNGTTLDTALWNNYGSTGTSGSLSAIVVNDGLTIKQNGNFAGGASWVSSTNSAAVFSGPVVADFYGTMDVQNIGKTNARMGFEDTLPTNYGQGNGLGFQGGSNDQELWDYDAVTGGVYTNTPGTNSQIPPINAPQVYTVSATSAEVVFSIDYASVASGTVATNIPAYSGAIGLFMDNNYQPTDNFYSWVRTRALPPGGVMPSVAINGQTQTTTFASSNSLTLSSSTTTAPASSGVLSSIVIYITNSQSSPTPVPFQQMITVDSAAYASMEAANLQNVEFLNSNGSIIPSWLESGNSNAATNTVYWLNLADGIPADSSVKVYMTFASQTTNLFNAQTTGEAPQLSPSYGQYDDGAKVFSLYDNFQGSTIDSALWQSEGSYTINNGISFATSTPGAGCFVNNNENDIYSMATFTSPAVAEAYGELDGPVSSGQTNCILGGVGFSGGRIAGDPALTNGWAQGSVNAFGMTVFDGSSYFYPDSPSPQQNAYTVFGLGYAGSALTVSYINGQQTASSSEPTSSSPLNVVLGFQGNDFIHNNYNWIRVRAYPPNGAMPAVEINGQIQTTAITSSSSTTPVSEVTPRVTLYPASVEGQTVTINGVATPGASGAPISSINWNWGDGRTSTGSFPQIHTYLQAGNYNVVVIAIDSNGQAASAIEQVSISSLAQGTSTNSATGASSSNNLLYAVIAVVILLAIVGAVVMVRRRGKPQSMEEPPMTQATSEPRLSPETSRKLEQLKQMFDKGLITQEDFEEQKRKLMGGAS